MIDHCPKCHSKNLYQDRELWICPDCAHEFGSEDLQESADEAVCRDANGQILQDGDAVILIKDLKVKGASSVLKSGTKVRSIRLIDPEDGHNISCKIDGFGGMNLKSEFVKKA